MKKSYLMIAAAVVLISACQKTEEIQEISTQGPVIGFNTFYQKATKAENSGKGYTWDLSDHHSTFKVWSYKNTSATAVFDGEEVRWDATLETPAWTYDNNRYWDKVATDYYFYACAPYANSDSPFKFNGVTSVETQSKGYFTVGSSSSLYSNAGENVSAYEKCETTPKVASTSMVQSWKTAGAVTDVDLMIAEEKHMSKTASSLIYNQPVQLNFIHILSRLNISIKTVTGFDPAKATDDIIVVNNITIGNMNKAGYFEENKTLSNNTTLAGGTYERWTTSQVENNLAYSYDLNYEADLTDKYVIETLILPQVLEVETIKADGSSDETKPYLYIKYTIWNHTKQKGQEYEAYYNLATILTVNATNTTATKTAFNEGWQNTIHITLDPDMIKFAAKTAIWDDTNDNGLEVN